MIHKMWEKYCLSFFRPLAVLHHCNIHSGGTTVIESLFADVSFCMQARSPTLTATELKERLLKEKVMALRKSSTAAKEQVIHRV